MKNCMILNKNNKKEIKKQIGIKIVLKLLHLGMKLSYKQNLFKFYYNFFLKKLKNVIR